jgi:glycosyltransferase involved in cell wall biosynthesis
VNEVSHVITTIERGGAENQLLIIVREQVLLGMNVKVIPLKGDPELLQDLLAAGAQVDLNIINRPIIVQVAALRKALSKSNLIHAHLPRAELLAALSARKNFVFSRHNTEPFFPGAPRLLSNALSRFVTLRAIRGIAISEAVRKYLIESGEIASDFRVDVVLYGIPDYAPTDLVRVEQLKTDLEILDSDFIVGTIARLAPQKDLSTLLRAFAMTHTNLPNAKLMIVGGGPDQAILASKAAEFGIANRVIWIGRTSEIYEYLAIMDVFVLTSLYEGFGLPVIEAMAAGVPVACSNTTSLPEVAAEAAILFDPRVPSQIAQAMISLVENDALRAHLIQAGLQRADEFSDTERMAREYWDLFKYALSNEKYENQLTGAYADGWAGPRMSIQVAPDASSQTLELEFSAPDWLPQSPITIQTILRGNPQGDPLVLQRGTSAVLSLALEPVGGCYEVVITPTFVPARSGHGDDQRELSVILQRCVIVRADGQCIELFPKKISA